MRKAQIKFNQAFQAFGLVVLCGLADAAQSIEENYSYFEDIVRGLGIDPGGPDVWDIGNAEYSSTGNQIVGMYAYYKKMPRLHGSEMCIIESRSRQAEINGDEFSWSEESIGYQVWLSSTQDCDIQSPDEIPQHSLVSEDVTLQEASLVLQNQHYLFQEVLIRSHPNQYHDWGTYRLSSIRKTDGLPGAEGQVFIQASFASRGKGHGPTVYLQIERDQIVIEVIGAWDS
jgi:hypothetical protein